jgi:glucose/mannose transport system permease protein
MSGAKGTRSRWSPARIGIYAFLFSAALFFLLPLYVMLATSFKPMDEIRMGNIFAFPLQFTLDPWREAWSGACTGLSCEGIKGGFWNSVAIAVPSTVLPILLGAINGYALSFWRPARACCSGFLWWAPSFRCR